MKTWIIDWGEQMGNGGRYALVQTVNDCDEDDVFMHLDGMGDPSLAKVSLLKIPEAFDRIRYVEIAAVEEPYAGKKLKDFFADQVLMQN